MTDGAVQPPSMVITAGSLPAITATTEWSLQRQSDDLADNWKSPTEMIAALDLSVSEVEVQLLSSLLAVNNKTL